MARPSKPEAERRIKRGIRLDPELDAWVQQHIGVGRRFKDLTHAIETGLVRLRTDMEREDAAPGRPVRGSTLKK